MDITTIDAMSFATRVGQVAAAELYGLLSDEEGIAAPVPNWFHPRQPDSPEVLAGELERLGEYVCRNRVEQGERLYRWAVMAGIVPAGEWGGVDFAGREAFEVFADTCRSIFLAISVAQLALEEERRKAGVTAPALRREDSIFEEEDRFGTLRPEALAAGPLLDRYQRSRAEAGERAAAEKRRQDAAVSGRAADPELAAGRRTARPSPVAAGETLPRQRPDRGGRGRRKSH